MTPTHTHRTHACTFVSVLNDAHTINNLITKSWKKTRIKILFSRCMKKEKKYQIRDTINANINKAKCMRENCGKDYEIDRERMQVGR